MTRCPLTLAPPLPACIHSHFLQEGQVWWSDPKQAPRAPLGWRLGRTWEETWPGVRLRVSGLGSLSGGITQPPLFLQRPSPSGYLKLQVYISKVYLYALMSRWKIDIIFFNIKSRVFTHVLELFIYGLHLLFVCRVFFCVSSFPCSVSSPVGGG